MAKVAASFATFANKRFEKKSETVEEMAKVAKISSKKVAPMLNSFSSLLYKNINKRPVAEGQRTFRKAGTCTPGILNGPI